MEDKYPEFSNLRSDEDLRESILKLNIENPTDQIAVNIILQQKGFSSPQRKWINSLVSRKGKKFIFKDKK